MMASREVLIDRYMRKTAKGIPVSKEEQEAYNHRDYHPQRTSRKKPSASIQSDKLWMQQFIDWKDKTIPVGKRRVAYVRYLMMKFNYSLERAKYYSKMHIH